MLKIRSLLVRLLAATVGRVLLFLQPDRARKLGAKGMTVVMGSSHLSPTERLMRRAILKRAEQNTDVTPLANLHKTFWTKQGAQFFSYTEKRLEEVHLPYCEFMFQLLREELQAKGRTDLTLVEIGCGSGLVLERLSATFPEVKEFIGIDLCEEQIKSNWERFKNNTKLNFITADAIDWIDTYHMGNTIFLTFMGVYEYFPQEVLHTFFKKLYTLENSIILAIEPNGIDHDFEKNPNSEIYGPESSFSHNYVQLLESSRFRVWYSAKKRIDGDENYISFIGATN